MSSKQPHSYCTTTEPNDPILTGDFASPEHKYWRIKNVRDDKLVSDYLTAHDIEGDSLWRGSQPNVCESEKIAIELGMLTEDVYYAIFRRCYSPHKIAIRKIYAEQVVGIFPAGPVQRHRFPLMARRISSSVGSGLFSSRTLTVIMKPGVQYPHCAPPVAPHSFWRAVKRPSSATPSTVVISLPSQEVASNVQASMGIPSISTAQAPQEESSQPRLEPVSPRSRRNTSSRSWLGSTANWCPRPFTRKEISSLFMTVCGRGLVYRGLQVSRAGLST